ncbi:MAG TPA: hypothetical protein VEK80_09415 [Kribbellaceae bacterium]|nr:hypothetical protein [Kribbellaceae bacterium]
MPRQRAILCTTVVSTVVALVIGAQVGWASPIWWAFPGLALAVALSEAYSARLVIGGQTFTSSLTEALLAVALLVSPGFWVVAALVLGYGIKLATRRVVWLKLSYNLSNWAFAAALAVALTRSLGGGIVAAGCGILAFAVVNQLLVSFAVSLVSGRPYHRVLREAAVLSLVSVSGNASVGLLGAWLVRHQPVALVGLVIPICLLWWSYEQQARRTAEARLFAELARGQETIVGTSVDTSAQVVVAAAARVFGGADVELLLRHPDGLVRYIGDEDGVRDRSRAESEAFGAPWVLRAMAARGVLSGVDHDRPFVSAILGDSDRPLAVLVVRRPPRAGEFSRADMQLAKVLVSQAQSWLSMADLTAQADEARGEIEIYRAAGRVLGDMGTETAPALVVLRESSDRLARLANRFDGPDAVSQIVDELHAVERAVASLLGAIALAQPAPEAAPRAQSEWTTTGRMEPADDR